MIRNLQYDTIFNLQSLVEASRKSEGISRENFISETTIGQIRLILVDAERRRGKPYFETDPASGQNPSMLVHTLERCIQELIKDIEIRKSKIEEVWIKWNLNFLSSLVLHVSPILPYFVLYNIYIYMKY